MISPDEFNAAMRAVKQRLRTPSTPVREGVNALSRETALLSFAGSDLPGPAVMRAVESAAANDSPEAAAGAALMCFWLGWELRGRSS